MRITLFFLAALLAGWGCRSARESAAPTLKMEFRELDTLEIVAAPVQDDLDLPQAPDSLPTYRATPERRHDLLHTRLELRFNWENETVKGRATLNLSPYFYSSNELTLDAKGFTFHQVSMVGSEEPLTYKYDGQRIGIQLDKTYRRGETYSLYLDYTAKPRATGGSSAITSDRGLFFVNPTGRVPGKPQQIWTQGETEHNSRWFPTIDQPNERCTQEMFITVDDRFLTLSNGLLRSSTRNDDGTRTDYWKLDQAHAPYLFMLAVGEFAVVRDEWNGIPLAYYVEPAYKADARAIFAHTPEMLTFFSEKLGLQYPWPKYSQIVVKDYVSGAMENTTASVFGDFVQRDRRELYQDNNDRIVAHELFHQWFGNYVTCESWSNLTLNEGFANYSEYLWFEHKYGRDEADMHLMEERNTYIQTTLLRTHPLIHFQYAEAENMFDAHSYNKGGAVLHMLRHQLGDEAFFAGLNQYLVDNAYQAVEIHDLRLAFEKVTGRDLNGFFDQWYLSSGHPDLNIQYAYEDENRQVRISVRQEQDFEGVPGVFRLPTEVEIRYADLSEERYPVVITKREQTFTFPVKEEPLLISLDPNRILLCERRENRSPAEYALQYRQSGSAPARYEALNQLFRSELRDREALFQEALDDPSWQIRDLVLGYFEEGMPRSVQEKVRSLARFDPHARIRESALITLFAAQAPAAERTAVDVLERDSAFAVLATALQVLAELNAEEALPFARNWEKEFKSLRMIQAVAQVYASAGLEEAQAYFERHLRQVTGYESHSFLSHYGELLLKTEGPAFERGISLLFEIGRDPSSSRYQRYAAANALNGMKEQLSSDEPDGARLQLIRDKLDKLESDGIDE